MKRRMEPFKPETRKAVNSGKAAQPELRVRIKDPGRTAASPKVKKTEPDVYPVRKVPSKGRPTKGGAAKDEKLVNKRI
jgi:hypothetical protein